MTREAEQWSADQGVSLNQFILWSVAEKVGALKQNLDDPAFPRVTYRRGASGNPAPVLRGTGIRIQTVAVAAHQWDLRPDQIATEYGCPLYSTANCRYQNLRMCANRCISYP